MNCICGLAWFPKTCPGKVGILAMRLFICGSKHCLIKHNLPARQSFPFDSEWKKSPIARGVSISLGKERTGFDLNLELQALLGLTKLFNPSDFTLSL